MVGTTQVGQGSRTGYVLMYRSGSKGKAGSVKSGAEMPKETPGGILACVSPALWTTAFCLHLEGILQSLQYHSV